MPGVTELEAVSVMLQSLCFSWYVEFLLLFLRPLACLDLSLAGGASWSPASDTICSSL